MRRQTSITWVSVFIMSLACVFFTPKESSIDTPTDTSQLPIPRPTSPSQSSSNSGICKNKYMPLENDITKVYSVRTTITGVESVSTNYETIFYYEYSNYFTVSTRLGSEVGYPVDDTWDCSDKGLTKSAFESGEFSNFFMSTETGFSTRRTGNWCPGGITLPSNIQINDLWVQQTDFRYTSTNLTGWYWFQWNILHQPLNVKDLPFPAGSGRFIYKYKAVGFETIKVPAGTFDSLRIDVTAEGYLTPSRGFSPSAKNYGCAWSSSTVEQVNPVMTLLFEGSTWWVSDIGWVKKQGNLKNLQDVLKSYEMELESIEMP